MCLSGRPLLIIFQCETRMKNESKQKPDRGHACRQGGRHLASFRQAPLPAPLQHLAPRPPDPRGDFGHNPRFPSTRICRACMQASRQAPRQLQAGTSPAPGRHLPCPETPQNLHFGPLFGAFLADLSDDFWEQITPRKRIQKKSATPAPSRNAEIAPPPRTPPPHLLTEMTSSLTLERKRSA